MQKRFEPHPRCGTGALPEFTFLNTTAKPMGWNDESLELLWRYNLHYFDYINVCGEVESGRNGVSRVEVEKWRKGEGDDDSRVEVEKGRDEVSRGEGERGRKSEDLMERWIDENPRGSFPGWDPYPTSLRIVNWVKWLNGSRVASFAKATAAKEHVERVECSLKEQADWLVNHIEYHLLANHLLANAKALVFAGKYFDRKDWYGKGLSIYRQQLPEQTCSDGVNFERSPMYHAIIFEDMLDLAEYTDEPLFKDYAARMADGMRLLTGPDGKIAKFNDATEGIAKQPAELLGRAEKYSRVEVEKWRMGEGSDLGRGEVERGRRDDISRGEVERGRREEVGRGEVERGRRSGFLRMEAGEWTLIAKCGEIGPSYQPGHAHADTWSFELWKSGKKIVGDTGCSTYVAGSIRSYERSTKAHNTVVIDGRDSSEVWASHRVGRRFDRKRHRREFQLTENGLKGIDYLSGKGEHDIEVRFHLPPGVDRTAVNINCPGELSWETCEFAEGWNLRESGLCAVYSFRLTFPSRIEWSIA